MQFETKAIHAGQDPDPSTGGVIAPVFQTSTYQQEAIGKHKGYEYSRTGNPTRTALETCLAELEAGRYGLAVRMREHEKNAKYLAEFLSGHEKVARVYYPGLEGTRDHEIASRQMRGFGGMVSFESKGGPAAVERFLSGLKLFLLAESLGGVESLVSYPARMTHASLPEQGRLARGITDALIRLSVGIENVEDLKADLENALRNV